MPQKAKSSLWEKLAPFLLVVCLVLAFFAGSLWQKVSSLRKNGGSDAGQQAGTGEQQESPISVTNLKKMAKALKLKEKEFNKCLDGGKYAQKVKDDQIYGEKVGVSGTPAFFINGKFLGGAYPYENFKEIIDIELAGKGKSIKEYSDLLQKANGETPKGFDITPKQIEEGDSPVLGSPEAKVTIVEFSDFECPYCARHFTETWPEIKSNYLDKGLVRLVFKNYPLPFHSSAQKAAEAAECAKEQGKFWEMHDEIFKASSSVQQ